LKAEIKGYMYFIKDSSRNIVIKSYYAIRAYPIDINSPLKKTPTLLPSTKSSQGRLLEKV